ncbi:MAG: pimeloyl-ACP methyl ester carboxylesterase [Planctomycetota bacterium]|jgi:pimeloyl-ACP methyl ester carboxylesterase
MRHRQSLGCPDWGDALREPVLSDIPTLFVSGTFDAATPPDQAELVRAGFPNSGHLIVQFSGYDDLLPDPRVQKRIVAFLAGAQPQDELLERPMLEFAPLFGSVSNVSHPALGR